MAFKMSTGLASSLMGKQDSITGATLTITNGTTITDSDSGFLTAGFRHGDTLLLSGWPTAGNNTAIYTVGAVTAGSMTVSGTPLSAEGGDADSKVMTVGKSFKDIFRNGVIRIYSGTVPADADADEGSGVLLLEITKDSGAFTPGTSTNGLNFDAIAAGVLSKNADVWSDAGIADGAASWWRLYDNGLITGASTTAKRCQGRVSTAGTVMELSSTSVKTGATVTLDKADMTMPMS